MSWFLARRGETAGMNDSVFDREADLLLAYQFGLDYMRDDNPDVVERDFLRMFSGDAEALEHYEAGKRSKQQEKSSKAHKCYE